MAVDLWAEARKRRKGLFKSVGDSASIGVILDFNNAFFEEICESPISTVEVGLDRE